MTLPHMVTELFVSQTEPAPPGGGGFLGPLVPLGLMLLVVYFLLIRPANKQRRDHQSMLNALKKDDEVVTTGGIYGKVVSIEDRIATLEIADKVKIRVLRDRIAGRWEAKTSGSR